MDDNTAGALNLARFVAATAGRHGSVAQVSGGVAVASVVRVANGYVNAAVPVRRTVSASAFLGEAAAFFDRCARSFVLWVPDGHDDLHNEAVQRGGQLHPSHSPAMAIRSRPTLEPNRLRVQLVESSADTDAFGALAESGYETPGLAWVQAQHGYDAPGTKWVIAYDGARPVGVACGYVFGETGGVYYVATPPEHRGRGIAAAATGWITNALFDDGVEVVTLQSSSAGLSVYERLGFNVYSHYNRYVFEWSPE
jgi:ribosomal protein S18 acetylase RimI-like enzyme